MQSEEWFLVLFFLLEKKKWKIDSSMKFFNPWAAFCFLGPTVDLTNNLIHFSRKDGLTPNNPWQV